MDKAGFQNYLKKVDDMEAKETTEIWLEDLFENCPPNEASQPNNFICYRLSNTSPPDETLFFSHRKLYPFKTFSNECEARGLSVFNKQCDCEKVKKLSLHKNKHIVSLLLRKGCGLIYKTGKNRSHYSWWAYANFREYITITAE